MLLLSIIHHYIFWHYGKALDEIRHVTKNLLWFVTHFFSLQQLLRSLASPYRRITEERGRSLSFEDLAGYIIINLISRIIGLILRLTIILVGITSLLILCFLTIVTYIIWLSAPLFLLVCLLYGIRLLIPV